MQVDCRMYRTCRADDRGCRCPIQEYQGQLIYPLRYHLTGSEYLSLDTIISTLTHVVYHAARLSPVLPPRSQHHREQNPSSTDRYPSTGHTNRRANIPTASLRARCCRRAHGDGRLRHYIPVPNYTNRRWCRYCTWRSIRPEVLDLEIRIVVLVP